MIVLLGLVLLINYASAAMCGDGLCEKGQLLPEGLIEDESTCYIDCGDPQKETTSSQILFEPINPNYTIKDGDTLKVIPLTQKYFSNPSCRYEIKDSSGIFIDYFEEIGTCDEMALGFNNGEAGEHTFTFFLCMIFL